MGDKRKVHAPLHVATGPDAADVCAWLAARGLVLWLSVDPMEEETVAVHLRRNDAGRTLVSQCRLRAWPEEED